MAQKEPEVPSRIEPLSINEYLQNRHHQKISPVVFNKPVEIGAFSIDGKRKFHNDRQQLAYIRDDVSLAEDLNLNDGYEDRFIKRDEGIKERLDHLLRWMVCNLHRFKDGPESVGKFPDFILWRGHMTRIMCTPYENQDGWRMAAEKVGSTIYISEVETQEAEKKRLNRTEKEKRMMYWGVRFEKYMTTPHPPKEFDEPQHKAPRMAPIDHRKAVVNTNEAYCTIVRGHLNSHQIIHGAEVDCCLNPSKPLKPPDNYIELKTSREFSVRKQEDNFHKYKTKKWWAQSFLAGVPQITCGFRNDKGSVVRIEHYQTMDLPRMAKNVPGGGWDANRCLEFLDKFLTYVKSVFGKLEDPNCVLLFDWNPGEVEISCKKYSKPTSHAFLPEWYITSLKYA